MFEMQRYEKYLQARDERRKVNDVFVFCSCECLAIKFDLLHFGAHYYAISQMIQTEMPQYIKLDYIRKSD